MKIVLFGASGVIGTRILDEALRRGHIVTAVMRDPSRMVGKRQGLTVIAGDVTQQPAIEKILSGHDAVVSAIGPGNDRELGVLTAAAETFLKVLPKVGITRLIIVGDAGCLEVAPGKQFVDTPQFPLAFKAVALAHREALTIYRRWGHDLRWTQLSPPADISPGLRTGKFRLGTDQLLSDANGRSHISTEDFAIALLDELESPKHLRQQFAVAY